MIKVKGVAVAPAELEDLLLGRPTVEDVAVGIIPHDYTGQHPKAHVVLKPGILHSKDRLTIFSLLRQIVRFVRGCGIPESWRSTCFKETPKSASGKILRRVLRELGLGNNGKGSYMVGREVVQSNL